MLSILNKVLSYEQSYHWMIAAIIIFTLLYIFVSICSIRGLKGIPSDPLSPIFGNLLSFFPYLHQQLEYFQKCFDQYGSTFSLIMPFITPIVVTTNPSNIEHILKTNFDNYVKPNLMKETLSEVLGKGIFSSNGAEWKKQRSVASHLFTMRNLKTHMTKLLIKHSKQLVQKINKYQQNKQTFDLSKEFYDLTFDTSCDMMFSLSDMNDEEKQQFSEAFDRSQMISENRWFLPHWRIMKKLSPFLPFETNESILHKDIKLLNDFAYRIIQMRRAELKNAQINSTASRNDLLSLFISMKDDNGNDQFTDEYLRDVIINFLVAGRDTTAATLSWTEAALYKDPESLEKLEQEIDEMFSKHENQDSDEIYADSKDLTYLHAIIHETLRLYPSVPRDPKQAVSDDILPSGHVIPAGTIVAYYPYSQGRSEDIWGQDCRQYKPSRWITKDENGKDNFEDVSPFKLSSFQAGPRMCIGKHVAILQLKITLSMLHRNFRFQILNPDVGYKNSVTLQMAEHLRATALLRH